VTVAGLADLMKECLGDLTSDHPRYPILDPDDEDRPRLAGRPNSPGHHQRETQQEDELHQNPLSSITVARRAGEQETPGGVPA
jgi:hypothetical protein